LKYKIQAVSDQTDEEKDVQGSLCRNISIKK